MQRLIMLIALAFALAATFGGASSSAIAYSSVTLPDTPAACSDVGPTLVVSFKPCGKTKSGIVIPCLCQPGILAENQVLVTPPNGVTPYETVLTQHAGHSAEVWVPPPIAS